MGSAPARVGSISPARSALARRQRRRRRGSHVGKPLRLGVLLVGLVGINVYVFFFNRGTAPREILNMQSTSKRFETTQKEALAADVRKAGELVASSSGDGRKSGDRGPGKAAAPAAPSAINVPFAPPHEAVAVRAPAAK